MKTVQILRIPKISQLSDKFKPKPTDKIELCPGCGEKCWVAEEDRNIREEKKLKTLCYQCCLILLIISQRKGNLGSVQVKKIPTGEYKNH